MTYEWLFAFAVFADHLNFTRAARTLHISQPALHVQIKKLAEAVGRPLYVRRGRALVLTAEGVRLAAFGREVEDRGRALLDELRGHAPTGPIVLAAGQGALLHLLGPAIRRFPKQRWPLRLLTLPGPAALDAVREARAHLAVVAGEPPTDLATTPLRNVGQHAILPRGHRLARRRRVSPRDFDEPLIVAPVGSAHRAMLELLWRQQGLALPIAVEATGWQLMLQYASVGLGATIVNDFCAPPRGMVAISLAGAPRITYYTAERASLSSPAVATLRSLLIETTRSA